MRAQGTRFPQSTDDQVATVMELRRTVDDVCGLGSRLLTGHCVEASSSTTTTISSSSSLPRTSRRFHRQTLCCGDRELQVSSPAPSRYFVALYLVWIWLLVTVTAPDLPRSRSRHRFRFVPPLSATTPSQDTTHRHSTPPSPPPSGLHGETVDDDSTVSVFTLPPVWSSSSLLSSTMPRSTRRLSIRKILEGSDELLDSLIRRPESRSQIETLHRPNAEVVASIRVSSVPVALFRQRLRSARSYRDVIRIFVRSEEHLRDEDIDDFISSPSPNSRQSMEDNSIPVLEWEMAMNHLREMEEKGACRQPVPKFIQVRHHELARTESNYVPECTVVYRCHKDYGCCNSTSECGVKTSTYIYRSFWELTCPPGTNCTEYNMPSVKTLRFVNHTECECKPVKQLPRCKLCPEPFDILTREDFGRCNCTCPQDNQRCQEMETGRIPMDRQQANCIRESNCEKPHCQYGDYDTEAGYCPCSGNTSECRSALQGQGQSNEDDFSRTNETETSTDLLTTTNEQMTNEQHQATSEQHWATNEQHQTTSEQHRTSEQLQITSE